MAGQPQNLLADPLPPPTQQTASANWTRERGWTLLWWILRDPTRLQQYINGYVENERAQGATASLRRRLCPRPSGACLFLFDVAVALTFLWLVLELTGFISLLLVDIRLIEADWLSPERFVAHFVWATLLMVSSIVLIFFTIGLISGDLVSAASWALLICISLPLISIAELWLRYLPDRWDEGAYVVVVILLSSMIALTFNNLQHGAERRRRHINSYRWMYFFLAIGYCLALASLLYIGFGEQTVETPHWPSYRFFIIVTFLGVTLAAAAERRFLVRKPRDVIPFNVDLETFRANWPTWRTEFRRSELAAYLDKMLTQRSDINGNIDNLLDWMAVLIQRDPKSDLEENELRLSDLFPPLVDDEWPWWNVFNPQRWNSIATASDAISGSCDNAGLENVYRREARRYVPVAVDGTLVNQPLAEASDSDIFIAVAAFQLLEQCRFDEAAAMFDKLPGSERARDVAHSPHLSAVVEYSSTHHCAALPKQSA